MFRSSRSIVDNIDNDMLNKSIMQSTLLKPQPSLAHRTAEPDLNKMRYPKLSILKARTGNTPSKSQFSRFDRRGHAIDESTRNYGVTFADDIKETEAKLADVVVVESWKEHNYDNTHKP